MKDRRGSLSYLPKAIPKVVRDHAFFRIKAFCTPACMTAASPCCCSCGASPPELCCRLSSTTGETSRLAGSTSLLAMA